MHQQIKDAVRYHAPEALYPAIAMPYFYAHPARDSTLIRKDGDLWRAENLRRRKTLWYPLAQNAGRAAKYGIEKAGLYQLPGRVEVEPGDVVVDVGAYVGEFTSAIAPTADRVLAIEPDPTNVRCLRANTQNAEHVDVVRALLDSAVGERTFHVGADPTENSIFEVDASTEERTVTMEAQTISDVCSRRGIERIDFLKLEAEGAEPEVLEGAVDLPIRKLAVGVGPERNGESTRERVADLLLERKYEIRKESDNVLFATANDA